MSIQKYAQGKIALKRDIFTDNFLGIYVGSYPACIFDEETLGRQSVTREDLSPLDAIITEDGSLHVGYIVGFVPITNSMYALDAQAMTYARKFADSLTGNIAADCRAVQAYLRYMRNLEKERKGTVKRVIVHDMNSVKSKPKNVKHIKCVATSMLTADGYAVMMQKIMKQLSSNGVVLGRRIAPRSVITQVSKNMRGCGGVIIWLSLSLNRPPQTNYLDITEKDIRINKRTLAYGNALAAVRSVYCPGAYHLKEKFTQGDYEVLVEAEDSLALDPETAMLQYNIKLTATANKQRIPEQLWEAASLYLCEIFVTGDTTRPRRD